MDINDFIRPPYRPCPRCSTNGVFGVVVMTGNGNGFTRRCKNCRYQQYYELPVLKPKVIYLDQFVVSEMTKALDPTISPARRARLDPYYKHLFEKIDRLCKLHLIICPDSPIHYDESVVDTEFKKLKRINELLSNRVVFYRPELIRETQVLAFARKWIKGEPIE